MLKYEAVDENNNPVSRSYMDENICSSTIPCILYFLNFGLSTEGSIDMNLISYKNSPGYYLRQFFFDVFLYSLIHMIFFNLFLATISEGFDKMKEKIYQKEENIANVCFICQKTKNDCIKEREDFDSHLKTHNKWKYIIYIIYIMMKNKEDYSKEEYYVWKQIKRKKLEWFLLYND